MFIIRITGSNGFELNTRQLIDMLPARALCTQQPVTLDERLASKLCCDLFMELAGIWDVATFSTSSCPSFSAVRTKGVQGVLAVHISLRAQCNLCKHG